MTGVRIGRVIFLSPGRGNVLGHRPDKDALSTNSASATRTVQTRRANKIRHLHDHHHFVHQLAVALFDIVQSRLLCRRQKKIKLEQQRGSKRPVVRCRVPRAPMPIVDQVAHASRLAASHKCEKTNVNVQYMLFLHNFQQSISTFTIVPQWFDW